jgi:hypothetical protein
VLGRPRRSSSEASFLFRLRLSKVLPELETACRETLQSTGEEHTRTRAHEIALAVSEACRLEGLRDASVVARSLASLLQLPKDQILPVEAAFRDKVRELVGSLRSTLERVLTESG